MVAAGQVHRVEPNNELSRVQYARLVRKRAGGKSASSSVRLGVTPRVGLTDDFRHCWGGTLGYRIDFADLGLDQRLGYCTSRFENARLRGRTDELQLTSGVYRAWDLRGWTLDLGGGLGLRLLRQSFDAQGRAPTHHALSPLAFVGIAGTLPVAGRFFVQLDSQLEAHLYRYQATSWSESELRAAFAYRAGGFVGLSF